MEPESYETIIIYHDSIGKLYIKTFHIAKYLCLKIPDILLMYGELKIWFDIDGKLKSKYTLIDKLHDIKKLILVQQTPKIKIDISEYIKFNNKPSYISFS